MRAEDLTKRANGRVVRLGRAAHEGVAFVPAPLPPKVLWDGQTVSLLSTADRALGRLAGVGQTLPNPHLLIGSFKRREAVLSSRIEGTQASMDDLLLFEAAPTVQPRVPDVLEVWNYVRALEHGLERQKNLPMSKRLMREMHGILLDGVRGQEHTPGEFRRSQNWIGPPGCSLADATFVPPPPSEMCEAIDALEAYLHEPSTLPPLVRLAMIHYQFEAIHPFLDGNGRIGRLMITLLLCMEGILPGPLLYLSAYFERRRSEYYAGLLNVSCDGQWTEWITFFLRGVAEEAMDGVDRATRLLVLRERYREAFHSARSPALLLKLIDELFAAPAMTVARAAEVLCVTPTTARRNIDKLVHSGILRESTGRKRHRVFLADKIISVLNEQRLTDPPA